ncbi:MAG: hypothetical protein NTV16_00910 [Actinobacteria bacterium]|nr:hypothetical protein [Actinomycetota bacterium]
MHNYSSFGHDGEKTQDTLITDDQVYAVCGATTAKKTKGLPETYN